MKTITGDLLDITSGTIMHQVHCRGACGGLAGALRRKWPKAFLSYAATCRDKEGPFGSVVLGIVSPELVIAHVFGQKEPGPHTDLIAVNLALRKLACMAYAPRPLYAPYLMGCGLGGGDWVKYSALIEKNLPETTIVKLP